MKKTLFTILMTLLVAMTFNSCTIENDIDFVPPFQIYYGNWTPGQTNGNGQYCIGGYAAGQSRSTNTRAAVSQTYDDKFSLYAWTTDSTVMNNYHGVFGTDPNSGAPTWGYTEDVKYFDNFVPEYNFIGVIPQSSSHVYDATNHTVTVSAETFTVENNDLTYKDDREILYAKATVSKANYSTGASLAFNNLNSKVYLQFTSDDANTQILDFTPYTPGTPSQPAWDETVDVTTYTMSATTVPTLGPLTTAITISDADIELINSKYTASKGFSSYQSSNTITGNLDENMWDYLLAQYPTLASINLGNWDTYTSNTNMRLVHLDKAGHTSTDNDSYRAVWVNIQSVNWNAGTTTQTVIHHDAVVGTASTGVRGVLMLPATSVNGIGTDAVLSTYPSAASVQLSLNGVDWTTASTDNSVTFTKPSTNAYTTPAQSPTTWFTFPAAVNTVSNLGYTIKFSYRYKGVNVYDARVFIPANVCNWQSAKYYTYSINITGRGNGYPNPTDPQVDETDPTIPTGSTPYQITASALINDYTGETWVFDGNSWTKQ